MCVCVCVLIYLKKDFCPYCSELSDTMFKVSTKNANRSSAAVNASALHILSPLLIFVYLCQNSRFGCRKTNISLTDNHDINWWFRDSQLHQNLNLYFSRGHNSNVQYIREIQMIIVFNFNFNFRKLIRGVKSCRRFPVSPPRAVRLRYGRSDRLRKHQDGKYNHCEFLKHSLRLKATHFWVYYFFEPELNV